MIWLVKNEVATSAVYQHIKGQCLWSLQGILRRS